MIHWLTQRFWPRLYRAATKWQQDDGLTWAASLAYYGAFSFFPLVLVILAGAGLVLSISSSAQLHQQQLVKLIGDQTSPQLAQEVAKVLSGVKSSAAIGGPIGLRNAGFRRDRHLHAARSGLRPDLEGHRR